VIPQADDKYLKEKAFPHELMQQGSEIHVVLKGWSFPEAYTPRAADVLIRLLPGYPITPIDMFWTSPDIKLVNGAWPLNSATYETHGGRAWQRWSRHTPEWRPGIDNLRTFITAITAEINRGI
jgi:hypothetical protein